MPQLYSVIIKRLLFGFLVLFAISILIFLGVEALPGDLAETILGQSATPETVAAFRKELGLDQPPVARYIEWMGNFLQGDLGRSLANGRPVADLLSVRLGNTLLLASMTAVVAVPISISLGLLAALFRGSFLDKAISITTLGMISMPEFLVAYILIAIFAVELNLFPSFVNLNENLSIRQQLNGMILPVATLTIVVAAHMMRMTRAAIINVLASPYIEMAHLKGIRNTRIILRHAMPNALSPIINVVVLNLAYLVVGVVLVEVVFVYPGLGQLLVDSVAKRDLPLVQASCLVFAMVFVGLNLLADILSILANPKLRTGR